MKTIKEFLKTKETIIGIVLALLALLITFSVIWGNDTFSVKSLSQIIYHLKVPMDGTDNGIFLNWFIAVFPKTMIMLVVIIVLMYLYKKYLGSYKFNLKHIGIIMLLLSLVFTINNYQVLNALKNMFSNTTIYEDYYVDPSQTSVTFNEGKRNLIHIYLESMENTYLSNDEGGGQTTNYIKELGEIAQNNLNFSNNELIGGWVTVDGTQWTTASMVSQTSGIPLTLNVDSKSYDENSEFISGAYTMGDILNKEGYYQKLYLGSESNFGCTSNYYKQHGNYDILDYDKAKEEGRIAEDYKVFWGFEDKKLFDFVKEDLKEISSLDQPFNLEVITIDTHTPDGYICDECEATYDTQYYNAIACSSHQVSEFIEWLKTQDYYDNTTIVITGDHLSMAQKYFADLDDDYIRTPYNVIINSTKTTTNDKFRQYASFDMYPTILSAMGATIKGDKLGLGTDLFSDKETLIETLGFDKVNKEIQKQSSYYSSNILDD